MCAELIALPTVSCHGEEHMSSLNPYSSILKDAGDILKAVPYTREQLHGAGLILCVQIPCGMGAATGTIAADSLKHPTSSSRVFVLSLIHI